MRPALFLLLALAGCAYAQPSDVGLYCVHYGRFQEITCR